MNRKEIIEYLSPIKTGPIIIEQKLSYTINGFSKNDISYSFTYECDELGISWRSDGAILTCGFNRCSVFDLFSECNLDVDYLKSKQRDYETVPVEKKELKLWLQAYKSRTIEVLFSNEDWRRDYWFCKKSNYLKFHVYIKEESRFIFQIAPAKFMLDIVMDNSPTSRSYELSTIPGKKGVFDYATASIFATAALKEIANHFSQFGFMLYDETIKQIENFMVAGEGCTGEIHPLEESSEAEDDSYYDKNDNDDYSKISDTKIEYLSIFGLEEDAIWDDVVYARNAMIKVWHPDKWMNDERRKTIAEKQVKKINNAFDELKKIFEDAPQPQEQQNQKKHQESNYEDDFSVFFDYLEGENGKEQNFNKAIEIATEFAKRNYAPAQYELGLLYYNWSNEFDEDYVIEYGFREARKWFEKAAIQGNADAQGGLGDIYFYGNGVEQDYEKARYWYEKAADQGDAGAQNNLACIYHEGLGVEQNYQEAKKWCEKAATQGNADAQGGLGDIYFYGDGVEKDYEKARYWYEKAADQGDAGAQNNLACIYHEGLGVEQNYQEAMKWYLKAAEQNFPIALAAVGSLYENGFGVKQDYKKAMEWYLKAEAQDNSQARYFIGRLYENGLGVEKDYKKAMGWYLKSDDFKAQISIGNLYRFGKGVKRNYRTAMEWYLQVPHFSEDNIKELLVEWKSSSKNEVEDLYLFINSLDSKLDSMGISEDEKSTIKEMFDRGSRAMPLT